MKRFFLIILLTITALSLNAQEKKLLTAEDAAYINRKVFPQRQYFKWLGDENTIVYSEDGNLVVRDAMNNKTKLFLTLDQFNEYVQKAGLKTMKRIPNLNWTSHSKAWFHVFDGQNNLICTFDLKNKSINLEASLPAEAENINVCEATMHAAYTIGNDLYISKGRNITRLTENAEHVIAGQSVHRNEFAIDGGIFWSPDGSRIAYYSMDESMVGDYPLVDITTREAEVTPIKYPMAGMTSHIVKLHVYDIATKNDVIVKTGEPEEQYLTAITWNNDNRRVYIGLLNRGQNHLVFNEYNAENGDFIRTIFEDTDEQYVEPQGPAHFVPGSDSRFVWMAQRDGFYHLYLYDISKGKVKSKQLTKGNFVVTEFNGFDKKGENIYYTSTEKSPLQRHFYMMNLSRGTKVRITKNHGTHSVQPSADGRFFIDTYSSTDFPFNVDLIDQAAKYEGRRLFEAPDPLSDYAIGKTILDTIKAEDGQDLYTRMILPYNFDESKKYPVIVYVYGGPHAQMITDSWLAGGGLDLNFLATQGFIVFTLDNRGSDARGEAFEQVIHRQCGQNEMNDQMKGIEYLRQFPFVDMERIGSDGWSYGGFMSTSLKINHPEVFKVSVAGGPVLDWKYYEIMYGERYMDTPEENPEGYELTSLENKADKLEGKLLIIHCTTDPVVVWQHSLVFIENCIHAGKQLDYFVYPGHEHNVRGTDRAHLMTKIANYFKDNL